MRSRKLEKGMALTSALLLLLVTTMLGVAMFRGFGLMEAISGNTREKQRALHAATSAQYYAEWWLTANKGVNAGTGTACSGQIAQASIQVCSNIITNPWTIPWTDWVDYTVPGMNVGNASLPDNYVKNPRLYISFISSAYNSTTGTQTSSYQIDALGYAGTDNSAAVAESAYNVSVTYTAQNNKNKFINLGGP